LFYRKQLPWSRAGAAARAARITCLRFVLGFCLSLACAADQLLPVSIVFIWRFQSALIRVHPRQIWRAFLPGAKRAVPHIQQTTSFRHSDYNLKIPHVRPDACR
jgi:hypothetical protein